MPTEQRPELHPRPRSDPGVLSPCASRGMFPARLPAAPQGRSESPGMGQALTGRAEHHQRGGDLQPLRTSSEFLSREAAAPHPTFTSASSLPPTRSSAQRGEHLSRAELGQTQTEATEQTLRTDSSRPGALRAPPGAAPAALISYPHGRGVSEPAALRLPSWAVLTASPRSHPGPAAGALHGTRCWSSRRAP